MQAASGRQLLAVLHGARVNIDQMVQGLRHWRTSRAPKYTFSLRPWLSHPVVLAVLTRVLTLSRGRPHEAFLPQNAEELRMLQELRASGLVASATGGSEEWCITAPGMAKVCLTQQFSEETQVFQKLPANQVTDADYLLSNASFWQLLSALQDLGWSLQRCSKKMQRAQPPHVRGAEDLVLYLLGKDIERQRAYCISLLCSDVLFEKGTLTQIHHGHSKKYYLDLLTGQSSGEVPDAGEDAAARAAVGRIRREVDEHGVGDGRAAGLDEMHVPQVPAFGAESDLDLDDVASVESFLTHVSESDSDVILEITRERKIQLVTPSLSNSRVVLSTKEKKALLIHNPSSEIL